MLNGDHFQSLNRASAFEVDVHCCQQRHYSFCIKKCGRADCAICKPPRLPPESFSQIHHLPDPTPASDGHYKQFSDVYGKATTEAHRPSIAKRTGRTKSLPFVASVRNVMLMIQCEECGMWRLLYSPRKLSSTARQNLPIGRLYVQKITLCQCKDAIPNVRVVNTKSL